MLFTIEKKENIKKIRHELISSSQHERAAG